MTLFYLVESTLFGVPLSSLLENDQKIKPSTSIPLFLQTVRTHETLGDFNIQSLNDTPLLRGAKAS